jgi:hypothetical protein
MFTNRFVGFRIPAGVVIAVMATILGLQPASIGGTSGDVELHIKAAYLFNFGRYVSWPDPFGEVVIGVVGGGAIVDVLEKTISGKTINGRAYRVKVFRSVDHLDRCEILFLPRAEAKHAQTVLAAVSGKSVLTVSDSDGFTDNGGMIEFRLIDDTLKFDINPGAAEKAGLKISSELLRVARDIKGRRR